MDFKRFVYDNVPTGCTELISYLLRKSQKDPDLKEYLWYKNLFIGSYESIDLWEKNKDSLEYEPKLREPVTFWIVSDLLATQLKKKNALLTNHFGFWIWGKESKLIILEDPLLKRVYKSLQET
mgnify:FL=1